MDLEAKCFLHFYQTLHFKKSESNTLNKADCIRKCLIANNLMSRKWQTNNSTCHLLEADLNEYATLFDEEKMNYSEFVSRMAHTSQINENVFGRLESSLKHAASVRDYLPTFRNGKNTDVWDLEFSRYLLQNQTKENEINKISINSHMQSNKQMVNSGKPDGWTAHSVTGRQTAGIKQTNYEVNRYSETNSNRQRKEYFKNISESTDQSISNNESTEKLKIDFQTASERYRIENMKKKQGFAGSTNNENNGIMKRARVAGLSRNVSSKFVPPIRNENDSTSVKQSMDENSVNEEDVHPALKNIEPKMVELIKNEIMDTNNSVRWDDIAGLTRVKSVIQEIVVLPLLRPDIFTGIRQPPKGVLLFGPPGTGKTLIGKCVASQVKSTFFSISASSLTSKWIGESEKMVRALFAVARCYQPSVVFIDEIDSLLSQRSDTEHESSRRLKTEFLVQLDGAATGENDRILVIGATNRPQELDEAVRRRFVKRLYIPLPDVDARAQIVKRLMLAEKSCLSEADVESIAIATDGYSGADMTNLCKEASLGPIRSIDVSLIETISLNEVRAINVEDFKTALKYVRTSVSFSDLDQYIQWDKTYGSTGSL